MTYKEALATKGHHLSDCLTLSNNAFQFLDLVFSGCLASTSDVKRASSCNSLAKCRRNDERIHQPRAPELSLRKNVLEYKGIRYGIVPKRFEAPRRWRSSEEVDGSEFAAQCLRMRQNVRHPEALIGNKQRIVDLYVGKNTTMAEECLTLNIWTKAPVQSQKRAVLLWYLEDATDPSFWGHAIADDEDIVVITATYRQTIFGFPASDSLPPNLGLNDHLMALQWVHANIEAFGGDANKIVVGAQGRPASRIAYALPLLQEKNITSGFILQSPAMYRDLGEHPAKSAWFNRAALEMNCVGQCHTCKRLDGSEESSSTCLACPLLKKDFQKVVECMQSADWEDVLSAATKVSGLADASNDQFQLATNPGSATSSDPEVQKYWLAANSTYPLSKTWRKVGILTGYNANETGLWQVVGMSTCDDPKKLYSLDTPYLQRNLSNLELAMSLTDEYEIQCSLSVGYLATQLKGMAQRYAYSWEAQFPELEIASFAKIYRGVEIPVIWGTADLVLGEAPSAELLTVGRKVRKMWGDFIKQPLTGLSSNGWPPFKPRTYFQQQYESGLGNYKRMSIAQKGRPLFEVVDAWDLDQNCMMGMWAGALDVNMNEIVDSCPRIFRLDDGRPMLTFNVLDSIPVYQTDLQPSRDMFAAKKSTAATLEQMSY